MKNNGHYHNELPDNCKTYLEAYERLLMQKQSHLLFGMNVKVSFRHDHYVYDDQKGKLQFSHTDIVTFDVDFLKARIFDEIFEAIPVSGNQLRHIHAHSQIRVADYKKGMDQVFAFMKLVSKLKP